MEDSRAKYSTSGTGQLSLLWYEPWSVFFETGPNFNHETPDVALVNLLDHSWRAVWVYIGGKNCLSSLDTSSTTSGLWIKE